MSTETAATSELKLAINNGAVYALPHGAVLIKGALNNDEQKVYHVTHLHLHLWDMQLTGRALNEIGVI
jgi:hypothetical protein